jgi:hypothetical protein
MTDVVDAPEGGNRRLNRMVATTVVALSVVMAVGKIKDDNIVQAMQADQASKIDLWNEYQATKLKAHAREIEAVMLDQLGHGGAAAAATASTAENKRYASEAKSLRAKAQAAENDYDVQGRRDDQFDLSDGFFSIAIAVAAIAALIESIGVLTVSWIAAGLGLLFLVAGFAELPIHPDFLVNFLT